MGMRGDDHRVLTPLLGTEQERVVANSDNAEQV